jgi:hypothetical protein
MKSWTRWAGLEANVCVGAHVCVCVYVCVCVCVCVAPTRLLRAAATAATQAHVHRCPCACVPCCSAAPPPPRLQFVRAVKSRWPHAVLQFEDFQMSVALTALERYRK